MPGFGRGYRGAQSRPSLIEYLIKRFCRKPSGELCLISQNQSVHMAVGLRSKDRRRDLLLGTLGVLIQPGSKAYR